MDGKGGAPAPPDLLSEAARVSIEGERADFARRLRALGNLFDDLSARIPAAAREARALADLLETKPTTKEGSDGAG
jgi:hypothetical protein